MDRLLKIVCFAAVLLSVVSCKFDTQSTESFSATFDKAEAVMMGYVDPAVPENGVYWLLHLYSDGVQTAYFTIVSEEGEDAYFPEGTYTCGTLKSPKIGTFIQGSWTEEMIPQYSYFISGEKVTDMGERQLLCLILTDGTVKITKDKDNYALSSSLFSFATEVSLSFKGEIQYANEGEDTED